MRGRDVLACARVPSLLSRLVRSWVVLGGFCEGSDGIQWVTRM